MSLQQTLLSKSKLISRKWQNKNKFMI